MSDDLPSQVDPVSAEPSVGNCEIQGKKVNCELGTLANGASATVTIEVTPKKAGLITNEAEVESEVEDPQTANNRDTENTTVTAARPQGATCKKKAATIAGTDAGEILTGTEGKDVILARGGDDEISAGGGKDLICAGDGIDLTRSGSGNDFAKGQGGSDTAKGQGGGDTLKGNRGRDNLKAAAATTCLPAARAATAARAVPGATRCEAAIPDPRPQQVAHLSDGRTTAG